jgi:hypothetical protein
MRKYKFKKPILSLFQIEELSSPADWLVSSAGSASNGSTAPPTDHTSATPFGHYLFLNGSTQGAATIR